MSFIRTFIKDTRGNFSTSFAVGALATLVTIGAGLDVSHANRAKDHLQKLNDNAALAAALDKDLALDEKKVIAKAFVEEAFDLNYDLRILTTDLIEDGDTITIDTKAEINTMVLGVFGKDTLSLNVVSEVNQTREGGPVEISFVFDTTASMNFGSKWQDVTRELEAMLKKLENGAKKDEFRASLVPFSDRVNLGKFKNQWIDKTYLNPHGANKAYKGCVEPREENIGGHAHTLTNKTQGDLKFVPSTVGTYGPAGWYRGGVPYCSTSTIIYPTNNVVKLEQAVGRLQPGGTGRFDVGLAWGYRMLSNTWRNDIGGGQWPKEDEVTKVAVFLTDGFTIAYEKEVGPPAVPKPWGRNKGTPEGFANVLNVCDQMKAENIQIHVIGVNPHTNAELYFKQCATSLEHYHPVNTANDIIDAIGEIGVKTSDLRVSG